MTEILYELIFINLLMVANGIFSMSEMAVVSSRRARLQKLADQGRSGAATVLELAGNPNSFLSTVQIGITVVGVLAGAFGGAGLSKFLAAWLNNFPALAGHSEQIAFFLVVAGITYLSLVIGELVPKRLALSNPERIACLVGKPMKLIATVGKPLVWLLDLSSELLVRVLRVKAASEPAVTEEELKFMVRQAREAGVVEKVEEEIVHNVFGFTDKTARQVMTPGPDICWLDIRSSGEEIRKAIGANPHTYYPVCRKSLDQILGIVSVKDLWLDAVRGEPADLQRRLIDPLYVPLNMPGMKLLETFKQSRKHFALVVNEYAHIEGIVTIQDVLQALVGELPRPGEQIETIVKRADGSWLLDGLVGVDKFKEVFKLGPLPGEDTGAYETMGGFVMFQLKRIPRTADRFIVQGLRIEVVDMDGNRVDKLMVTPEKK